VKVSTVSYSMFQKQSPSDAAPFGCKLKGQGTLYHTAPLATHKINHHRSLTGSFRRPKTRRRGGLPERPRAQAPSCAQRQRAPALAFFAQRRSTVIPASASRPRVTRCDLLAPLLARQNGPLHRRQVALLAHKRGESRERMQERGTRSQPAMCTALMTAQDGGNTRLQEVMRPRQRRSATRAGRGGDCSAHLHGEVPCQEEVGDGRESGPAGTPGAR